MNGTQMKLIPRPRLLQLIPFTRNVGPLRVGPERSQRRLVAKFGGDMPHYQPLPSSHLFILLFPSLLLPSPPSDEPSIDLR